MKQNFIIFQPIVIYYDHFDIISITVSANPDGQNEETQRRIARRSFQKTFVNYDSNLDLLASTAEFHNGLLSVTVPRKATSQPVIIDIA